MKVNEFLKEIEGNYNKYFTNSKCHTKLSTSLYHDIDVRCYLANNENECVNGYWENDMLSIIFSIETEEGEFPKDVNLYSDIPENLILKIHDKSYLLKSENQYLAYGRKNLSFRKTKGNSKKLINTLDKYFKKLHDELLNDIEKDNIHKDHISLLKNKII